MKRIIRIAFAFALILCVTTKAVAAEKENVSNKKEMFLRTKSVDTSLIKYVKKEMNNILDSLNQVLSVEEYSEAKNRGVGIGNSFVLGDINYLPIICNEKIIALISISEYNGEKGWYLEKGFSGELNKTDFNTSKTSPVELFIERGDIFAKADKQKKQLTFSKNNSNLESDPESIEDTRVVNIMEIKEQYDVKPDKIKLNAVNGNSKYLKLDLAEKQKSDEHWCVAYAGASIMRYRGHKEVYARNIMRFFYDINPDQLKKKSLSYKQLMKYANKTGMYPETLGQTLGMDSVKREINNNMPIFIAGWKKKIHEGHAVVLRGYNANNKTYSIWNPNNYSYSVMSESDKVIPANGGGYIWKETIRNWQ